MENNNFETDAGMSKKKDFLKRVKIILVIAIFLTGASAFAGIFTVIGEIGQNNWNEIGMISFAWKVLFSIIWLIVFVTLLKIVIDKKPFSKTLTWSIRMIGSLFVLASFIIPRLAGYHSSGFELFALKSFFSIDGAILTPGLALIILGNIIMVGFDMQKEMDEIL